MASKSLMSRLLSTLAIAGCLVTGAAAVSLAQGLPGLVIFSGVDRENQLGFRLDYDGRPNQFDRYRLRISRAKMDRAVSEFTVLYPDTYRGEFDADDMELRVDGEDVPLDEVNWDRENREITFYPIDPVPPESRVEIVLSNVRNPMPGGTYYFNALVRPAGDIPLRRYVGTWIIRIGTE